jgi:5-methylthioadenosine/S-adenosylhomocysteine deaminase
VTTLLTHATVVTLNAHRDILDDGAVCVIDDRIEDVGPSSRLLELYPDAEVVDCTDRIIIPGLINTHTHLFQTLLKGLGDDMVLKDWFRYMTAPSAAELTPNDVHAAATHGAVEAIKSGTTTLADFMYVHPIVGLTDQVVRALQETGIRGLVGRGYMTTGTEAGVPPALIETPDTALEEAVRLIQTHNRPDSRVRIALAPTMIWTVDRETLEATRAVADRERARVMMHVSETPFEIENSLARFGARDVEVLADVGLLGPDLLAVHCVQCSDSDVKLLADHGVSVSHNPCSNLYLASGFAPIPQMLEAGIHVGLASDGPASNNNHNLIHAMKFAALMHKGFHRNAEIITAETVLEMATIEGACALGMEQEIGSVEAGKKADLVVLECGNFFATPLHHPVSALVYSALGSEPETVMIDGRIVMHHRAMQTIDETDVLKAARGCAEQLAQRAGTVRFKQRPWRSAIPNSPTPAERPRASG